MFKNIGYLLSAFVVGLTFFIIMVGVILTPELGYGERAALAIPLLGAVGVSIFAGYNAKNNIFKKNVNDKLHTPRNGMDDTAKFGNVEDVTKSNS